MNTAELENVAKGVIPTSTAAATQCAVKNYESWARSSPSSSTDAVPSDLLMSHEADLVCKWLCRFVCQMVLCKLGAIFGKSIVHNKALEGSTACNNAAVFNMALLFPFDVL